MTLRRKPLKNSLGEEGDGGNQMNRLTVVAFLGNKVNVSAMVRFNFERVETILGRRGNTDH